MLKPTLPMHSSAPSVKKLVHSENKRTEMRFCFESFQTKSHSLKLGDDHATERWSSKIFWSEIFFARCEQIISILSVYWCCSTYQWRRRLCRSRPGGSSDRRRRYLWPWPEDATPSSSPTDTNPRQHPVTGSVNTRKYSVFILWAKHIWHRLYVQISMEKVVVGYGRLK